MSIRTILACLFLCGAFAARAFAAEPSEEAVERGKALVEAGDCASCHTADPTRPFAGGKRIDTPFGAVYSPNLTPDRETGIGAWSDQDFYNALRFGVDPDGSRYYPAFPYPNFTKLTRPDILAIRAYLATLTPFANEAPPPQLRFPLNYRAVMRLWNFLFFKPGRRARTGIVAVTWSRVSAIAASATARKTCLAPTGTAAPSRAAWSAAGSRHGSTPPSAAG